MQIYSIDIVIVEALLLFISIILTLIYLKIGGS